MGKGILKWLREHYNKIIDSIAFYPALIAVSFLFLSWAMLEIDFSEWGKHVKSGLSWLSLKDASTARTIISTVVGGIISLTVFSFSLVMIVLNQAASQMSNRILSSMIENRFQQVILGFYIGTIVYALFLLSTIRDINSGIYVPALSIYLLIILTVADIFLFIYFLDYVTQTVKFETVIERVQVQTLGVMKKSFCNSHEERIDWKDVPFLEVESDASGYFQGFDKKQIFQIAEELGVIISFIYVRGTYVIKGSKILTVYGVDKIDDDCRKKLFLAIDFFIGQPIERNADYGFRHLAEVALKALSPGINDPATAVLSINALSDLFAFRLNHYLPTVMRNSENKVRILIKVTSFNDLFENCVFPIWHYGKKDRYVQNALLHMLDQLNKLDIDKKQTSFFKNFKEEIDQESSKIKYN